MIPVVMPRPLKRERRWLRKVEALFYIAWAVVEVTLLPDIVIGWML